MDVALNSVALLFRCDSNIQCPPSAPHSPSSPVQSPTSAPSSMHRTSTKGSVVAKKDSALGPGQLAPLRLHRSFQGNPVSRPTSPNLSYSSPLQVGVPGMLDSSDLDMVDTNLNGEGGGVRAIRRRSKSDGGLILNSPTMKFVPEPVIPALPVPVAPAVDKPATVAVPTNAAPLDAKNKLRVLVVDDEPVNIMVVTRALAREGCFEITTGTDGVDVVKLVIEQGQRYDGLLLDERLKFMHGSEACRRVREDEEAHSRPEMPIIAISANVEPSDVKKYGMAGYSAVLGKPINVRCAGKVIAKFLETRKPLSQEVRRKMMKSGLFKINRTEDDLLIFGEPSSDIPAD